MRAGPAAWRRPRRAGAGRLRGPEPIVLGGGKTIFADDGEARPFDLVATLTANTGVLVNRYQRAR